MTASGIDSPPILVCDDRLLSRAEVLAADLGTAIVDDATGLPSHLRLDCAGLTLVGDGLELRGDYAKMAPRIRQNKVHSELLVKTAKIKGFVGTPLAVDATAGLGEDSLLLAAAGFEVELFERNPVVAALLEDTLARSAEDPRLAPIVARMHLNKRDSIEALPNLGYLPDVVLLDPMFPERQKSASVKKKLQVIQKLESPCDEEETMLLAALSARPRKLVIKRPPKGPFLAGRKPDYSTTGKAVRFDCIVIPRTA